MTTPPVLPEEDRLDTTYESLIGRLATAAVDKHVDAYADIDWDAPERRIDPEDPR